MSTDQLRAEVLKLRTIRSPLAVVLVGAVLELTFKVLQAALLTEEQLSDAALQTYALKPTITLPILAASLGVLVASVEWRHGTIGPTLLVQPRRPGVVATKAVAGGLLGALGALVAVVPATVTAWVVLVQRTTPAIDTADAVGIALGSVAGAALLAILGLGIGLLVPGQVSAMAVVTVATFVLAPLALLIDPAVYAWTPSGLLDAIAAQRPANPDVLGVGAGLVVSSLLALASVGAGGLALQRRDLT